MLSLNRLWCGMGKSISTGVSRVVEYLGLFPLGLLALGLLAMDLVILGLLVLDFVGLLAVIFLVLGGES